MENLAKCFVYIIVLGWAGTEIVLLASSGLAWPVIVGFLGFSTGFVVVGCAPLSDAAVEKAGKVFFSIAVLACLVFAVRAFGTSPAIASLKLIAAIVLGLFVLLPAAARQESAGH